jgi:hypothetical protein
LIAIVRARDAATEAGVGLDVGSSSLARRRIAWICGLDDLLSAN